MNWIRSRDHTGLIWLLMLMAVSTWTGPLTTGMLFWYFVGSLLASALMRYEERSRVRVYHMLDGSILSLTTPRGRSHIDTDKLAYTFAQERGTRVVRGPWNKDD